MNHNPDTDSQFKLQMLMVDVEVFFFFFLEWKCFFKDGSGWWCPPKTNRGCVRRRKQHLYVCETPFILEH